MSTKNLKESRKYRKRNSNPDENLHLASHDSGNYKIELKGYLDSHWSAWLGGMQITYNDVGNTCLIGYIPDQSALHGILVKIRDLGLPLLSINCLGNDYEKGCK